MAACFPEKTGVGVGMNRCSVKCFESVLNSPKDWILYKNVPLSKCEIYFNANNMFLS